LTPGREAQMREGRLWIHGTYVDGPKLADGIDPRTGALAYRYAVAGAAEVARAVESARSAQPAWAALPWPERSAILDRAREVVVERMEAIAESIMLETGKPPCECIGGAEISVALECLAYYAATTGRVIQPRPVRSGFRPYFFGKAAVVSRAPLGVIGAITPWNVPFSLAMGAIAPALAAGNTVVAKPSEYAPLSVLALAEALATAGLPPGVLNVVTGGPEVGRALVDSELDRIVFIGGARSGQAVYRALAERGRKPPVLELGGKDAMVVCADADVDYAAQGAAWNAFSNAGQQCCSVERVYVVRAVAEDFLARVSKAAARLAAASGFTESEGRLQAPTSNWALGPLIRDFARQRVHAQVTGAVAQGARLLAGGRIPEGPGFWYPPTVLADTQDDMAVMREETFGPVLPVAVCADEDEAIARANATPFGLTGSVWTRDLDRGRRLAARMQAALVMVNDHSSGYAMVGAPWGGMRASGFGRLHGPDAVLEVTEARVTVVDRVPSAKVWWYPYTRAAYDYFRWGNELLFSRRLRRRAGALLPVVRSLLAGRRQPGLRS